MPTAHHAPAYSLFADDNLNRLLNSFGLRTKGPMGIVYRSIFLWFLTWVPPALLFWLYSYEPGLEPRENFFRDVAGIGLPALSLRGISHRLCDLDRAQNLRHATGDR